MAYSSVMSCKGLLTKSSREGERPLRPREQGFTLIEVMIAAAVIAIVLIGVVSTLSTAFVADRVASESTRAQNYCRQTMETLMEQEFSTLPTFNGSSIVRGTLSANIETTTVAVGLVRVGVTVVSSAESDVRCQLVTLVADRSAP